MMTTKAEAGKMGQQLGPIKRWLVEQLNDAVASPYPLVKNEQVLENNLEELIATKTELALEQERLNRRVEKLQKLNDQWLEFLGKIEDDKKLEEETNRYVRTAEGEQGYINLLSKGEDRIDTISVWIREIESTIKNLTLQQAMMPMSGTDDQLQDTAHDSPRRLTEASDTSHGVHLPTIQLPTFDGDALKFFDFWDAYESAVHSTNISPVRKLTYLKGLLTGSAKSALSGISVNNVNYSVAVSILKERFGKKELIVDKLYAQLSNLSTAKSTKVNDLRQLVDELEKILRQLEVLGEDVTHNSLVRVVLDRLPKSTVLRLHEQYKGRTGPWNMQSLRHALASLVETHEEVFGDSSGIKTQVNSSEQRLKTPFNTARVGGFKQNSMYTTQYYSDTQSRMSKCLFCDDRHYSDECPNFNTLESRRKRFTELKRCFVCTRQGCFGRTCTSTPRECFHCKKVKSHCRMLCPSLFRTVTNVVSPCQEDDFSTQHTLSVSQDIGTPEVPMPTLMQVKTDPESSVSEAVRTGKVPGTAQMVNPVQNEVVNETSEIHKLETPVEVIVNSPHLKQFDNSTVTQVMTQSVRVINPVSKQETQARIFLDTGSQLSFISSKLAKFLKLTLSGKTKLSVNVFGNQSCDLDSNLTEFDIGLKDGSTTMRIRANTASELTGPFQMHPLSKEDQNFLGTYSIEIPKERAHFKVEIILGMDYFWSVVEPNKLQLPSGLHFIDSKLGPFIAGSKMDTKLCDSKPTGVFVATPLDEEEIGELAFNNKIDATSRDLNIFWSLESLGITDNPVEKDDEVALAMFNDTILYKEGRYWVAWPWKKGDRKLANTWQIALSRLQKLLTRLKKNPPLHELYVKTFEQQFHREVIEPVVMEDSIKVFYLPHHPVITPDKFTTKLRVVYDASAKTGKSTHSLNECLYRGPNLLPDLCGLLMRFRLGPTAVTADVEKAFHQICLQPEERAVTRFLWLKDPQKLETKDNIQIYQFCRVPFGVICSPFLLNATLKNHLALDDSEEAKIISDNIYVDNLVVSTSTVQESIQLYNKARELLSSVSMNLREWTTNKTEVKQAIVESLQNKETIVTVLGIKWDTERDAISLQLSHKGDKENCELESLATKRSILKELAGLFDPLGLFCPVSLIGKILLQKLWQEKLEWDQPVPENYLSAWKHLKGTLAEIPDHSLQRYGGINPRNPKAKNWLIVFCDASQHAYASAVYLRTELFGCVSNTLILAKTKLAVKGLTIGRSELMAILIGTRLIKFAKLHLGIQIEKSILLSDSKIALSWIKSSKALGVFVANRVNEIHKQSDIIFCYVRTDINPADIASRGLATDKLMKNLLWWQGPTWITECEGMKQWPKDEVEIFILQESDLTPLAHMYYNFGIHKQTTLQSLVIKYQDDLIKLERFSKYRKLVNTIKYVLKFLHLHVWERLSTEQKERFKKLRRLLENDDQVDLESSAHKILVRNAQKKEMGEWYVQQMSEMALPEKKSPYFKLDPLMSENGIIRVGGRYTNIKPPADSEVQQDQWYPILLPSKARFTTLLIKHFHEKNFHVGVQHTLSCIRKAGYWIPKGRLSVKKVLNKCTICRKMQGGAYRRPPMAPLPIERLSKQPAAFQNTGLDYLGPLIVKVQDQAVKMWICLFTCMSTRAVHLEVVQDLTAISFLNCLRRFIARRGHPYKFISDNAPQFKVVQKTLKEVWHTIKADPDVEEHLKNNNIQWTFIPEYSPWMGGFYERLVGLTKNAIKKSIGAKHPKLDELHTTMCEIEATINTRPLTVVTEEFQERCIRPIDLVQYNNCITGPIFEIEDPKDPEYSPHKQSSKDTLLAYWKRSNLILNQFKEQWFEDYILALRERKQLEHRHPRINSKNAPKLDDVILVQQQNIPRYHWKLAIITALHYGNDGQIRSATVRYSNGKVAKRPINQLFPLELENTVSDEATLVKEKQTPQQKQPNKPVTRSMTKQMHMVVVKKRVSFTDPVVTVSEDQSEELVQAKSCNYLPVKLGTALAILPERTTTQSVGLDLFASENKVIGPNKWSAITTDIYIEIPDNHFGYITARSSLALNYGITTMCGTIDADYRGPLMVILHNSGELPFKIKTEMKIAQLLIIPYKAMIPRRVNELDQTERGKLGFGAADKQNMLRQNLPMDVNELMENENYESISETQMERSEPTGLTGIRSQIETENGSEAVESSRTERRSPSTKLLLWLTGASSGLGFIALVLLLLYLIPSISSLPVSPSQTTKRMHTEITLHMRNLSTPNYVKLKPTLGPITQEEMYWLSKLDIMKKEHKLLKSTIEKWKQKRPTKGTKKMIQVLNKLYKKIAQMINHLERRKAEHGEAITMITAGPTIELPIGLGIIAITRKHKLPTITEIIRTYIKTENKTNNMLDTTLGKNRLWLTNMEGYKNFFASVVKGSKDLSANFQGKIKQLTSTAATWMENTIEGIKETVYGWIKFIIIAVGIIVLLMCCCLIIPYILNYQSASQERSITTFIFLITQPVQACFLGLARCILRGVNLIISASTALCILISHRNVVETIPSEVHHSNQEAMVLDKKGPIILRVLGQLEPIEEIEKSEEK